MVKIGVILSGCGVYDGAEIHEAVFTLYSIDKNGASYQCFAPNIKQMHVIDHLTREEEPGEIRNVMKESARIARGNIIDLAMAQADSVDALIIPGGWGAVKNLCDFATTGENCSVNADVLKFAKAVAEQGKPIGLVCIAPVMASHIYGQGVKATVGDHGEISKKLENLGVEHVACSVADCCVDYEKKVVSTPAYTSTDRISDVAHGVEKLVEKVLELC